MEVRAGGGSRGLEAKVRAIATRKWHVIIYSYSVLQIGTRHRILRYSGWVASHAILRLQCVCTSSDDMLNDGVQR